MIKKVETYDYIMQLKCVLHVNKYLIFDKRQLTSLVCSFWL